LCVQSGFWSEVGTVIDHNTITNLPQQQSRRRRRLLTHQSLTLEFVAVFPLEFCRILL
jgi:hypothetical protein